MKPLSKFVMVMVMITFAALSACGKKGDVKPPREAQNEQINGSFG